MISLTVCWWLQILLGWAENPIQKGNWNCTYRDTAKINMIGPSGTILQHKSGSTFVQVIACCLKALSHYLNQYWLIIKDVLWHSHESNFTWRGANSLWPSDAIWRHRSMSTLAQVMACCLTAPSHYLNQCWLMISEVLWHSPNTNSTENT